MAGLGTNFIPKSRAQIRADFTPPSGQSQEAIWHQLYDTQTYTDNSTTRLTFFAATNADNTLSNMDASGMLPAPQSFAIHNVCCDLWTAAGVSTSATTVGNVNDLFLLMLVGRPTWTLNISSKRYGPYSLSALHGTGGPVGFSTNASTAAAVSQQFAKNDASAGWNYYGKVGVPEQVAFNMEVVWGAAQDLTANWTIRMSLFGVLNRRVL